MDLSDTEKRQRAERKSGRGENKESRDPFSTLKERKEVPGSFAESCAWS